jgi:hypothetical protein
MKHSAILYSRSNIQFKNSAGQPVSLKFTSKSRPMVSMELSIRDLDVQGLSVELACVPDLWLSYKHESISEWSSEIAFHELLQERKQMFHQETTTTLVLIVGHELLRNKTDEVDDFLIEIVSGIRIVNALPYHLEVKCNESLASKSHSLAPKLIRLSPGKCTLMPMIRAGSTLYIRIVGKQRARADADVDDTASVRKHPRRGVDWIDWSPPIDLTESFQGFGNKCCGTNVDDETVEVPCKFLSKLKVKLRKVRDPSKEESFAKRYTSTPTIEIYTDFWIQNNSGIRLSYRMKSRTTGEVEVVNDNYCGYSAISSTLSTINGKSPVSGPILGLIAMSSIQLKCELRQEVEDERMISLQDFNNVTVQLPNLAQQSKEQWSPKVKLSQTTFKSYELLFGNLYLGLSLQPGFGVFHRTNILVITPRYVIQNLTSCLINVFPVRIWKRYRVSSTGIETDCKSHSVPPSSPRVTLIFPLSCEGVHGSSRFLLCS